MPATAENLTGVSNPHPATLNLSNANVRALSKGHVHHFRVARSRVYYKVDNVTLPVQQGCSAVPATRSLLACFADPSVFACLHMPTSQAGLHAFRVPVHDHASSLDAASPLVPLHCQA